MTDPTFPVSVRNGLTVVTTPEGIDIANAALLREALLSAAATRLPVIVVDMSSTEYCDSTGLNVLVRAVGQADEVGGELRLVLGGAGLRRILTVTGLGGMFHTYETLEAALEAA